MRALAATPLAQAAASDVRATTRAENLMHQRSKVTKTDAGGRLFCHPNCHLRLKHPHMRGGLSSRATTDRHTSDGQRSNGRLIWRCAGALIAVATHEAGLALQPIREAIDPLVRH